MPTLLAPQRVSLFQLHLTAAFPAQILCQWASLVDGGKGGRVVGRGGTEGVLGLGGGAVGFALGHVVREGLGEDGRGIG